MLKNGVMKRYEKYKASDIPWLPKIPAHWGEKRLKSLFSKRNEPYSPNESLQVLSLLKDVGIIPYSEKGNVGNKAKDDITTYNVARKGDIVMNSMNVIIGSVDITPFDGYISPAYYALYSNDGVSTEYYNYLFHLKAVQQQMRCLANGILEIRLRISSTKMFGMYYPFPPLVEQKKIVAYLNERIPLIENCKCQRERELQTLNELKQAEIASVVTRGLNPNVPMKDSGQIQFGEIPAHWDSVKMKYCFTQRSEKGFPNEPVLCATQSKGVIPQSLYENRVVVVNKGFEGLKLVKVGDFVISLRSFQGGIEYAYYQGIISAAYTILTPKDVRNSQYFKYLFKSHPFIQLLQTCVTGIREGQNINYGVLGNNFIPIPPIEEQNAIVEYIEAKTNKIDTMVEALKAEIDRLTEYKQRLISDVVTGQINVQD